MLFSRQDAEKRGLLSVSSGSSAVLAGTNQLVQSCVRFYFRPQTPTQFHAEGVRSNNNLSKRYPDAHCPVPVFFLFDSQYVLTLDDCRFSDGGLGSPRANYFSTADELINLPWKKIYHTGRFDPSIEDITFRRSAEVLVPNNLDLQALRYIYCRSDAEKETLLQLLDPRVRAKYRNKIAATSRSNLFFRKHTFMQTCRLSSRSAILDFSPETNSPGPFNLKIEIKTQSQSGIFEKNDFMVMPNQNFSISFRRAFVKYDIRVHLDNYLVFANSFEEVDIPF